MIYNTEYSGWASPKQTIKGNEIKFELELMDYADSAATDFHLEMNRSMCHMANTYASPIYLALSGGLDSEYVANVLKHNKIQFVPISLNFDNYNNEELKWAERWCKKNGYTQYVVNVSPSRFLQYSVTNYHKEYLTNNIGCYVNMFLADYVEKKHNGVLLTGDGDPGGTWGYNKTGSSINKNLEQTFNYWDVDFILQITRNGKHPRSAFSYFPNTVHSYMYCLNDKEEEQHAKSTLFDIELREKVDAFSDIPEWKKYYSDLMKYIKCKNLNIGSKQQALAWLNRRKIND